MLPNHPDAIVPATQEALPQHAKRHNEKRRAWRRTAFLFAALVAACLRSIASDASALTTLLIDDNDDAESAIPQEWDPPASPAAAGDDPPAAAAGSAPGEKVARSAVSFFERGEGARRRPCWIHAQHIRAIGCGMDGMVFEAVMTCADRPASSTTVSIKAPTSYNETARVITFREDAHNLRQAQRVYEVLYTNTTAEMRRHFALALGTVAVAPDVFITAVQTQKESPVEMEDGYNPHCYKVLPKGPPTAPASNASTHSRAAPTSHRSSPLLATVDTFAPGSRLQPRHLTSRDERMRVMRDLICIYRHMFERRFIHADVLNFYHILYDGHRVTLVDFSRVLFVEGRDRDGPFRQKMQLFQLVALLANVCAGSADQFEVPPATGAFTSDDDTVEALRRTLSRSLAPCQGSPHAPLFPGRDFSVARAYERLSHWSGGCAQRHEGDPGAARTSSDPVVRDDA